MALTLPAPDEKARVVRTMFDRIAPRYERLNAVLTLGLDRGWRRTAIAAAAGAAGARVVGIDFAAPMLGRARRHGVPVR